MHILQRVQYIPAPVDEVFSFFSKAENLEILTPAWLGFSIRTPLPLRMEPGTLIDYRIRLYGVPLAWRTLIKEWNPPHRFTDIQIRGPYKTWEHTHRFEAAPGGTLMYDTVRYELPFGFLGKLVERFWVRGNVNRIFDYRSLKVASLWRRAA